jgi:transposase InsO family protein
VKYALIVSNKAHWPITLACEVLGVSASGYFEHGRRKKAPKPSKPDTHKRMSDEALLAHIRAIHAEVTGEYGWPKMWKELVARGHRVGKERVRRLMQLHSIRARCKRKFVVTTDSKHHLPIAPDLVQRNSTPTAPNQVWTGDITYIATDEGWLYLAAVIDLFSRQVVDWSMQPHMQSSLVTDALKMAWFRRHPAPGLIFHSDRGSPILRTRVPRCTGQLQDEEFDEPQGKLLGQRTHGESVGSTQSGQAVRAKVCNPEAGDG